MKIKVDWEFDIENDHDTQEMLGLSEGDMEVILADHHRRERLQRDLRILFDVPHVVDLSLFFDEPSEVSDDQITDALSDEYGWLINGFEEFTE